MAFDFDEKKQLPVITNKLTGALQEMESAASAIFAAAQQNAKDGVQVSGEVNASMPNYKNENTVPFADIIIVRTKTGGQFQNDEDLINEYGTDHLFI